MGNVVITIDDKVTQHGNSTVSIRVEYPRGKLGPERSLAEAVCHDFKLLLSGCPEDFMLEYLKITPARRRFQFEILEGGKK